MTDNELRAAAAALESLREHEGWQIVFAEMSKREANVLRRLRDMTASTKDEGLQHAATARALEEFLNYPTKRAAELRSLISTEESDG